MDRRRKLGFILLLGFPIALAAAAAPTGVIEGELDPAVYDRLLTRHRVTVENFPLPDLPAVDLDLTSFEVLTPDARLIVVDDSGEREVPRPDVRAFRGFVIGDPQSLVTIAVFDGRISGSVRTQDGEFAILPGGAAGDPQAARTVTVRNRAADPDSLERPFCDQRLPRQPARAARRVEPGGGVDPGAVLPAIDGNTILLAQVAIDATYEWFEHHGSVEAAQSYILNILAQVTTIYESEVNVQLEVPFLRVFTTPDDPYTDTTDTSTLLDDLRQEWNAGQTGVDRTVAHLFSYRPSGGAGIAYLDVLCNHTNWPGQSADYGVSTMSALGSSWEKDLVAHELGHNFSSPHTHCYSPEIDQCATDAGCYQGPIVATTGTIMSYCSSSTSEFHARVEDEQIRPAAEEAYESCMTAPFEDDAPPDAPTGLTVD